MLLNSFRQFWLIPRTLGPICDIDEALRAASMIGDDRLQMQSRGYVVPESFTHGTAAQRSYWFRQGFENGTVSSCNTFGAGNTN